MKEFLQSVLGSYTPVTYDQYVGDELVSVIPSGLAGVDWLYVFSGVLLCITIFAVFKIIGGVICKIS